MNDEPAPQRCGAFLVGIARRPGEKFGVEQRVSLINNFVPVIGNAFTILTTSARTGQFATVNGLSINSGEHFAISHNPTNVVLTVDSGP